MRTFFRPLMLAILLTFSLALVGCCDGGRSGTAEAQSGIRSPSMTDPSDFNPYREERRVIMARP